MKNYLILSLIALTILSPLRGAAASENDSVRISRPITQIYTFEAGSETALDTYMSPLRYEGFGISLGGKWQKVTPWMRNSWKMSFDSRLNFGFMHNPAHNANMIDFSAMFRWSAAYRFRLPHRISVAAGAGAGFNAGVLYLPGNGNNPASVKADIGIGLTGTVAWPFKIGKLDVLVSDEVYLPSLSVFFSPEFGETYYEIYLGNHKGLAHCGWWGNHFAIDNLLAFDLDIGPSALRIGYRLNIGSSWINHINTRIVTNSFVVGWIPRGIGLKKNDVTQTTEKIVSLY